MCWIANSVRPSRTHCPFFVLSCMPRKLVYVDGLCCVYVVGLLELEESLPDILLKPVIKAPKRRMTTSAGFLKRKYREEKKLADIYQASQLFMSIVHLLTQLRDYLLGLITILLYHAWVA